MKKILLSFAVLALVSSCSLLNPKNDEIDLSKGLNSYDVYGSKDGGVREFAMKGIDGTDYKIKFSSRANLEEVFTKQGDGVEVVQKFYEEKTPKMKMISVRAADGVLIKETFFDIDGALEKTLHYNKVKSVIDVKPLTNTGV